MLQGIRSSVRHSPQPVAVWDLHPVFTYIQNMDTSSEVALARKSLILLALASGWRPKSDFARVDLSPDGFLLVSRNPKGKLFKSIWLRRFPVAGLCPVSTLLTYINRTISKRAASPTTLFFASTKSSPASPGTSKVISSNKKP